MKKKETQSHTCNRFALANSEMSKSFAEATLFTHECKFTGVHTYVWIASGASNCYNKIFI